MWASLFGAATAALGFLGLLGPVVGIPLLASIRPSYIPMAPVTAVTLLCLGGQLFVFSTMSLQRLRGMFTAMFSILVSAYGLIEVMEHLGLHAFSLETLLFPDPPMLGAIPTRRMAPTTAAMVLISGAVVPFIVLGARGRGRLKLFGDLAGCLGIIVATVGAVSVLSYLHGTPFLYDTATIPMAATTSIALLLLGIGQVLAAGPDNIPLKWVAGSSARARLLRAFVSTTAGVVVAIDLLHVYVPWLFFKQNAFMSGISITVFSVISGALIARVALKVGNDMDRSEEIRKQAEDKLRESEDRYRDLVEHSEDLICTHDLEGRILSANPWAANVLGYAPGELLGMDFRDLLVPEIRHLFGDYLDEIRTHGNAKGLLLVQSRAGERRIWEYNNSLRADGARGPIVRGMAHDVTERKRAEMELRSSEERYRSLFENMVEGFAYIRMIFDGGRPVDFIYLNVNEAFGDLTGLRDVVGKRVSEVIPGIGESDPRLFEVYGRVALTGKPERFEVYLESLSQWFSIAAYSPKREHVVVVFDIITDRKRAERVLRESEERYRTLFEQAGDYALILENVDGGIPIISDANEAALTAHGYSREELLGKPVSFLEPGLSDEEDERRRQALRSGGKGVFTVTHRRKDGSEFYAEIQARPVCIGGRDYYLSVERDVTERRNLEQQLRQAQKMEAVGRLAGGIAHDFNNLLTVINGYSELLVAQLREESPLKKAVEEIKQAGERAAALTRQLLAFSRQQVLEPKVLDLNEVVSHMERMLSRLLGEDVQLQTVLGSDLWNVKADPGQVEQLVMNLAVNARDAMPEGGNLTLETSNVFLDESYANIHSPMPPGPYVMLSVSDTGVGMDKETLSRVFEPFFTTKGQGKGTGLGLSTVYGVVKQSGGFIWVYSEPGKGATFKVYLPRAEGLKDVQGKAASPHEDLRGDKTILVVEDDESIRKLAVEILRQHGYTVLSAGDGEEALRTAGGHKGEIDLLLTDVVMPKIGGRELCKQLQQLRPATKVLYSSGYTDNAIVHHGVLDPGTAFLQKPYSPISLARKVKDVLDGK